MCQCSDGELEMEGVPGFPFIGMYFFLETRSYPTPWNRRNIILRGGFFGGDDMILFFICDVVE